MASAAPACADPSVPAADGTCYFFRLPRELRDQVYDYALYAPDGLFYQYRPFDTVFPFFASEEDTRDSIQPEINQLKYVCRQLHAETKGLVLKVNEAVNFTRFSIAHPSTVEQFQRLWESCGTNTRSCIRAIYLPAEDGAVGQDANAALPRPRSNVFPIIDLCRAHPDVQVNVRLNRVPVPRESGLHPGFMLLNDARDLLEIFRGKDINGWVPYVQMDAEGRSAMRYYRRERWRSGRRAEELRVSNLRFWPEQREFDEEEFVEVAKMFGMFDNGPVRWPTSEEVSKMADLLREWHEHGF
ncbi:hypothetical protein BU26DRAFT_508788 [Trematosphaeria pertusa]|uniref:Uncharacterized protein n=1 Tax=Trematosphaeria pertusa TaxID=390896 RepID=A0A6A6I480_9PLEO|nr:uncharacterized protein BU26DRAFT_508788 [Trematosphaeria pertusa]KAF2244808.1 hypothetical protein BU26DRAFT_508788 [Trematosphaeria pertusa]